MGSYNSAVITTAGQSLIARAIADNLPCTLTSAKTTDYVVPGSTSLASLTSLPDIKQSEAITSASVVSNTQVSASVRFNNTDITLNYMINTIGVYAKAGDDTSETLLAVITAIDPDVMPSYSASSPVSYVYDITLTISNASQVNIIVAPTGSPNYSEFNAVKDEVVAARVGSDGVQYSTLEGRLNTEFTDLKNALNGIREHNKNLFDPDNVLNAYFASGEIYANAKTRLVYIPCSPSTTYTVSKTAGTRFRVGDTDVLPAAGVTPLGGYSSYQSAKITYTTSANAAYLIAWVWSDDTDTVSADEMLASVQIELGSNATAYEPPFTAIDRTLRGSALQYKGILADGVDLNDLHVPQVGYYPMGVNYLYENDPVGTGKRKLLVVYKYGVSEDVVQILYDVTDGTVYQRMYISSAWTDWKSSLSVIDYKGALPSGTDLDTLLASAAGYYPMGVNYLYENDPVGTGKRKLLIVYAYGAAINAAQILYNISDGVIYQRVYVSSTWTPWSSTPVDIAEEVMAAQLGAYTGRITEGHGGFYSNAKYENSPKAFIDCRKAGVMYTDMDVVFTSDFVPVVAHSSYADNAIRKSDGDTSRIYFRDHTLADLQENYDFGDSGYTWTLQSLEEAYLLTQDIGCYIGIDVGAGSNNPTGSRETLVSYMIEHGIKCVYLVTSELDTFEILKASSYVDRFPLGIVVANASSDSLEVATQKINAIISAKNDLGLEKAWCLIRRERIETGGDLVSQVQALKTAGVSIGAYSYNASTYNTEIPSYVDLVVSASVNVNYERYKAVTNM